MNTIDITPIVNAALALIGAGVLSIGFSASTWNREKQYIA